MNAVANKDDRTLKELTKLLTDNNIDYFVKSQDGCVACIHFIVKKDE